MLLTVTMVTNMPASVAKSARPSRRVSSSLSEKERIALRRPKSTVAKKATNSVSPINPTCSATLM
ncbi:hypothetical protein D3C84_936540 [compost metagenome]